MFIVLTADDAVQVRPIQLEFAPPLPPLRALTLVHPGLPSPRRSG